MRKKLHILLIFTLFISVFVTYWSDDNKVKAASDIVNPNQFYTYDEMVQDIKKLAAQYPGLITYKQIGRSEYGRPIYAVSLGKGNAKVFINGSHHAREWITTNLTMDMIDQYARSYTNNDAMGSYNVRDVLNKTTMWFVPMVNPDGVTLQQYGLSAFPSADRLKLIQMNDGSTNFQRWKANARGVDLNRQYQADWANIKNSPGKPYWRNYKGTAPVNQMESKAIVNFTKSINPEMAVAYHSSGEILYWNFHQTGSIYDRDHAYAKKIGSLTGYRLIYPGPNPSGGGFTDWFVLNYKRPGFTPELGNYAGDTHVPISEYSSIWSQNKYVGLYVASEGYKLYVKSPRYNPIQPVSVKVNDKLMKFDESAFITNNRTYVPIRGIFEELDMTVSYNANTGEIIASRWDRTVKFKVGSTTAIVENATGSKTITFDTAPTVNNGRTMVPLRFIGDALEGEVKWDNSTYTASITDTFVEVGKIKNPNPINVYVNNEKQSFNPAAQMFGGDTVYVPLRAFFEKIGAKVTYDNYVATAVKNNTTMVIDFNNRLVKVNGKTMYLNKPTLLVNDYTMIPLRLISEAFGYEVNWSQAEWSAYIQVPADVQQQKSEVTQQETEQPTDVTTEEKQKLSAEEETKTEAREQESAQQPIDEPSNTPEQDETNNNNTETVTLEEEVSTVQERINEDLSLSEENVEVSTP
ncbi:stalk domain-containing protein [Fictibacillus arsenicus]|nr:stalk domain-containing protein [Fictibacillus arsenicus]